MTETIIPWFGILTNCPISNTVITFVVEYGSIYGIDFTKPARVEVDSIRYELFELENILSKDGMKIKIIQ